MWKLQSKISGTHILIIKWEEKNLRAFEDIKFFPFINANPYFILSKMKYKFFEWKHLLKCMLEGHQPNFNPNLGPVMKFMDELICVKGKTFENLHQYVLFFPIHFQNLSIHGMTKFNQLSGKGKYIRPLFQFPLLISNGYSRNFREAHRQKGYSLAVPLFS